MTWLLVISLSAVRVSFGVDIVKYLLLQITFFMNFDGKFQFDEAYDDLRGYTRD